MQLGLEAGVNVELSRSSRALAGAWGVCAAGARMFIMIPFRPGSREHVVYSREAPYSRDPHDSRHAPHLCTIIAPSCACHIRASHRHFTYRAIDVPNHTSAVKTTAFLLLLPASSLTQAFSPRCYLNSKPATCRLTQTYQCTIHVSFPLRIVLRVALILFHQVR